jgi:glycerol-3-phosphate acyltransferase PlsY
MNILLQIIFLILTYLVSSIPFGLVLTKFFVKKDVREFGSKNIGATNVVRVAGKKIGLLTLILDGSKGAIMVIVARFIFIDVSYLQLLIILISSFAVIGHVYPIYLNFKGGKGVATAIAVLLALDFMVGFVVICIWIMSFCLFRISSISSLLAIFSSIFLSKTYGAPTLQIAFCCFLFLLISYRHKENIVRLIVGEENKL